MIKSACYHITPGQVYACVEIINSIPKRNSKHIGWKSAPKHTAAITACILNTKDPRCSARQVSAAAGLRDNSMYCFLNGQDTDRKDWPELKDEVKSLGMECYGSRPASILTEEQKASLPRGFDESLLETTRCVIDKNTGDIMVITTHRVLYGSPDHRAKLLDMNAK